MNPPKIRILEILAKHKNRWLKVRTIAEEVGLDTKVGINKVSNILYRLRKLPYIERRNNSHNYQYRYIEDKSGYPTSENTYPKIERCEKAAPGSDKFNDFTFIEPLGEIRGGYCEICDKYGQVAFKAERNGSLIFLCKKHGERIDRALGGYGGVFQ